MNILKIANIYSSFQFKKKIKDYDYDTIWDLKQK